MRYPIATVFLILVLMAGHSVVRAADDGQKYPDVVDVAVTPTGDDRYRFDVTLSSPYDSPRRYADAFRVKTPDGKVLGVRELLHHHANEQPFTRSLNNVEVPVGTSRVVVEGRDQEYGYGGDVMEVSLPAP